MRTDPTAEDLHAAASFVNAVIDTPYAEGGNGPDAFDCWGLTRVCQGELFGRHLPIIMVDPKNLRAVIEAMENNAARTAWMEVEEPRHGDIVTLARHDHPAHIGTYLAVDRGGVLHTTQDYGVAFDQITALRAQGWMRLRFLRWREN